MSRIEPHPPKGMIRRATYKMAARKFDGVLPEPVPVTAHSVPVLVGWGVFEDRMEKAKAIDRKLADLAVMKTAALTGCEWCLDFGSSVVPESGVTEEQISELPRFRESDAFDAREKLVLEYAEAMTRTPVEVSDELWERLAAEFSEPELVELTAFIGIENYRARFNWALGIGSQGFAKAQQCAIPETGN
ncbi:MAG: carboxymuconolactone decarboxylase family protein [Thermoleophilaceae bacterium]|nr:carboxymuconolactone decarboxylase family protein [Thermoleophilaceae bacterium]